MNAALTKPARAISLCALFFIAGCRMTVPGDELSSPPQNFDAYGQRWKFVVTHRFDTEYFLYGLAFGGAPRPRDFLYLYKQDGSKIDLHERIYALQKDGSYRKLDCCTGYGYSSQLENLGNKLIFFFYEMREKVTDCLADAPNASDNEQRSSGAQPGITRFLGEFEPKSDRVLIREFFVGAKEAAERTPTPTMRRYYEFLYAHRAPFSCDQSTAQR